jgi:hypothetical protein
MKQTYDYLLPYEQHQGCPGKEDKLFISVSDAKKAMLAMTKDYLEEAHNIALSNNKFDVSNILILQSNLK